MVSIKNIYILYYSKTGKTKELAKRTHEIFTSFAPKDFKIEMMSASEMNLDALKDAAGYIIGSPDYFSYPAGQIKIFFDEMYEIRERIKGRPYFCLLTHGGTGKAMKPLIELCNSIKLSSVGQNVSVEKDITSKMEAQLLKNCQLMVEHIRTHTV